MQTPKKEPNHSIPTKALRPADCIIFVIKRNAEFSKPGSPFTKLEHINILSNFSQLPKSTAEEHNRNSTAEE